jgi:7,8-dihydropterin-6-yl-methyl-4-(beta-D-ribofuranosyl)aminobenzene 5'-phosphate synthase
MRISVLVDNNSLIDKYFLAEPGLSFYIEDGESRILFDCGYSDAFLRNAVKMHIDLLKIDYIVISHSHLDHTWGLVEWIKLNAEARFSGLPVGMPTLVTHPQTFVKTRDDSIGEIGSLVSLDSLSLYTKPLITDKPFAITDRLTFLGQIPRVMPFEPEPAIGWKDGSSEPDSLADDSALVYKSDAGLVIITGCSHSGICNIIEYAKEVCNDNRVVDVIGGLHLLKPSTVQLQGTFAYLRSLKLRALHACHCTDLSSKIALAPIAPLHEVGSGLELSYN